MFDMCIYQTIHVFKQTPLIFKTSKRRGTPFGEGWSKIQTKTFVLDPFGEKKDGCKKTQNL